MIEKIAKQEGVAQGTNVQTEREVGRVMETMLGQLEIQQATQDIESKDSKNCCRKNKKSSPAPSNDSRRKERFSMEAEDINRGKKPRALETDQKWRWRQSAVKNCSNE